MICVPVNEEGPIRRGSGGTDACISAGGAKVGTKKHCEKTNRHEQKRGAIRSSLVQVHLQEVFLIHAAEFQSFVWNRESSSAKGGNGRAGPNALIRMPPNHMPPPVLAGALHRKPIERTTAMRFPTTHWDELAKASLHGDTEARTALDEFCRRYWQPVNAFIRWKGFDQAEAADLTQDFFLNFLKSRAWQRADRRRGSFRTFLLGA